MGEDNSSFNQANNNNEFDSDNIQEIIFKLEQERIEASNVGNYPDAEKLKLKVEELRLALDFSKKKELSRKHQLEMLSLEQLYKKEFEDLEMIYNNKFNEHELKSRQMEENLNIKHEKEMEKLYERLNEKLPKSVKYSKRYLDLKNQELNLAKQQKYRDAMYVKKMCEEIEIEDTERFNREKTEKIKSQSIKTANKHLNEKNALKKKIELEYEELRIEKQQQTEILVLKFKNKKNELEIQQKMENAVTENKNLYKAKTTLGKLRTKQYIFATTGLQQNPNATFYQSPQKNQEQYIGGIQNIDHDNENEYNNYEENQNNEVGFRTEDYQNQENQDNHDENEQNYDNAQQQQLNNQEYVQNNDNAINEQNYRLNNNNNNNEEFNQNENINTDTDNNRVEYQENMENQYNHNQENINDVIQEEMGNMEVNDNYNEAHDNNYINNDVITEGDDMDNHEQ